MNITKFAYSITCYIKWIEQSLWIMNIDKQSYTATKISSTCIETFKATIKFLNEPKSGQINFKKRDHITQNKSALPTTIEKRN